MRATTKLVAAVAALAVMASSATAQPDSTASQLVFDDIQWRAKPSANDMSRVYPMRARCYDASGIVLTRCLVAERGVLTACSVVSEVPADMDFGVAALALAPQFQVEERLRTGGPAAGNWIQIPVRFSLLARHPPPRTIVLRDEYKASNAYWPTPGPRTEVIATVILFCHVVDNEQLKDCVAAKESPKGFGFKAEALRMIAAGHFVAAASPVEAMTPEDGVWTVRVEFEKPMKAKISR